MGCAVGLALLPCMDGPIGRFFGAAGFMPFADDIKSLAGLGESVPSHPQTVQSQNGQSEDDFDLSQFIDPYLWEGNPSRGSHSQSATPMQTCEKRLPHIVDYLQGQTLHPGQSGQRPRINSVDTFMIPVHSLDDPFVSAAHSKVAAETFTKLGFDIAVVHLDRKEHAISKYMMGAILTEA